MKTKTEKKYTPKEIKKKWLRISIAVFCSLFLFFIVSWILTASTGIKAVKKEHESFLKFFYNKCKKAYKKDPKIGITWSTPQMGVSPRKARFWKRKLFEEKKYPSFEEWRKFYAKENSFTYSAPFPFIIESRRYRNNTAWMQEYYFWYLVSTRKYKHEILAHID
jgi:hypothetical protein